MLGEKSVRRVSHISEVVGEGVHRTEVWLLRPMGAEAEGDTPVSQVCDVKVQSIPFVCGRADNLCEAQVTDVGFTEVSAQHQLCTDTYCVHHSDEVAH